MSWTNNEVENKKNWHHTDTWCMRLPWSKEHTKPYDIETFPCSNASTHSLYLSTSKPLKRHDAPISMRLQSNSPYHTLEKWTETCFREHMLPTEDRLTTDVRTNRCRYKTHKETNIHLEIINEYQKTIEQYYTINNEG